MRKTKLFAMVLIMALCASLTACAEAKKPVQQTATGNPAPEANDEDELIREESPDNNQGEKDEIARESEHGPKEDNSNDDIIREESPDNNQGEKDEIAREGEQGQDETARRAEEEARRQEEEAQKQEEEARRQEEESYGGGYQYTLEDGTVVTTDHDLRDYVVPDDWGGYKLDIEKMIEDIWCVNGGSWVRNSVGYSWFNGTESSRGLSWETDSNMLATTIEFFRKEGVMEYRVFLEILECPRPHNHWLETGDHFLILGARGGDGIHPDTAALILHGLERMEEVLAVNGTEIFDDVSFGMWYAVY